MANWPSITNDTGSGQDGTVFDKAFFDLIKAFIQAGSHQSGLDANKPAECSPGDVYHATDTEIYYVCFLADTWFGVGGAADPDQVRLPSPEAGDFVTPPVIQVSSGISGAILDQQIEEGDRYDICVNNPRAAQKITLTGQTLAYVRFYVYKDGFPTGTVYCRVRKVSDDSIIETSATELDVSTLTGEYAWKEFVLTCSPDEAVRITIEFDDGDNDNKIWAACTTSDRCDGIACKYPIGGPWQDHSTKDMTIILYASNIPDAGLILNQTLQSGWESLASTTKTRNAQKITLTGDTLAYVRWKLKRISNPTGTFYARIRKVSDDSIIETSATELDVSILTDEFVWHEFALTCAPDEEVYVSGEYTGGDAVNQVGIGYQNSDECDGIRCRYEGSGPWTETPTNDMTIILFSTPPADHAKDEDTNTYWQPSPPDEAGAWLKMDLGSLKYIGGCRIYWGSEAAYRPTEYKIYTSPDDSTWTEVIHETEAAPASAWKEYNWYVQKAQYIKMVVTTHGASGTKIYEVDEYSKTAEDVMSCHGHGGL